jgi:hypothetical protein
MSMTPHRRAALAGKLSRLTKAATRANEMLLVAIYEAHRDGASYADIAYMIGDKSPSGIQAKVAKGEVLAAAVKPE